MHLSIMDLAILLPHFVLGQILLPVLMRHALDLVQRPLSNIRVCTALQMRRGLVRDYEVAPLAVQAVLFLEFVAPRKKKKKNRQ